MSELKNRVTEDMKSAMRAREMDKLGTIRMLLAAIKQKEVDERITLNDDMVVRIVEKLVKQRKDAIAAFEQAARTDLVEKEQAELLVLQAYMPKRLSKAHIKAVITDLLANTQVELGRKPQASDMGKLMAAAKSKLAGQADMSEVSLAIKTALSSSET